MLLEPWSSLKSHAWVSTLAVSGRAVAKDGIGPEASFKGPNAGFSMLTRLVHCRSGNHLFAAWIPVGYDKTVAAPRGGREERLRIDCRFNLPLHVR